jgi:hypothetical protein
VLFIKVEENGKFRIKKQLIDILGIFILFNSVTPLIIYWFLDGQQKGMELWIIVDILSQFLIIILTPNRLNRSKKLNKLT